MFYCKAKRWAALLGPLLALGLFGCAANAPALPGESAETAAAEAALQPLLVQSQRVAMGPDCAYAALTLPGTGTCVATAINLDTGEQRVLCSQPGCTHTDSGCPAWLYTAPNNAVAGAVVLVQGERVYWLVDGRYNDSADAFLDCTDLEGKNRVRLCTGERIPQDITFADHWFGDGQCLYAYGYGQGALYRFDPAQSLFQQTYGCADGSPAYVGLWQDKLLLARPDPEASGADSHCLLAVDPATGLLSQPPVSPWVGSQGLALAARDGAFYRLDGSGALYGIDLSTGRETRLLTVGEGEALDPFAQLTPLDGGGLLIDYSLAGRLEAGDQRVALLPSGESRSLPTTWRKDGVAPRQPVVLAQNGSQLLLLVGSTAADRTTLGTDGVPYTHVSDRFVYGVLPTRQYLEGSEAWTLCTLLGELY